MRVRNWRLVIVGGVLAAAAVAFFFVMMGFAPQSTDPAKLMEIVGQTSGVVIGIACAIAVVGLIGKKI